MNIEIYLPFPPTINNYYVKTSRGIYISSKGKKFRAAVEAEVVSQLGDWAATTDRLLLEVILWPPDKRKRDLDNYMKALLDSLTQCRLWEDDSQIDQLFVYRGAKVTNGSVFMRIQSAGPVIPVGSTIPAD